MLTFNRFLTEQLEHLDYFNPYIDITNLEPSATEQDILQLCHMAQYLKVKAVCVLPGMTAVAKKALVSTPVLVTTVISFPDGVKYQRGGETSIEEKSQETQEVISLGADEIDVVFNWTLLKKSYLDIISVLKDVIPDIDETTILTQLATDDDLYQKLMKTSDDFNFLQREVKTLVGLAHNKYNKEQHRIPVKIIIESGMLSDNETTLATIICFKNDVDYIKTSTGKVGTGAELNKVRLIYDLIPGATKESKTTKIKASGGLRTLPQLQTFEPYVSRYGIGWQTVQQLNNYTSQ
jgi:deoxyribose-phosphate aldolase